MKRLSHLDSLKGIAMLMVFTGHFLTTYRPDLANYYYVFPYKCLTAKVGVTLFGVITGYLAYIKGTKKEDSLFKLSASRYIYFVICAFFINSIYYLIAKSGNLILGGPFSAKQVIISSLTLRADIFQTYWCIIFFVTASVISYINGMLNVKAPMVLLEALLLYLVAGDVWTGIFLLGNIAYMIVESDKKLYFAIASLIIMILCSIFVVVAETTSTYIVDGIFSVCLVIFVSSFDVLKKIFSFKPLAYIGKISMTFFMLHVIVYGFLALVFISFLPFTNVNLSIFVTYVACILFLALISYPIDWLIRKIYKAVLILCDKAFAFVVAKRN